MKGGGHGFRLSRFALGRNDNSRNPLRLGNVSGVHTAAVIHCSSFCFGAAPIWREASSPFLKIIRVGIDMMPYLVAVAGFSSTLSFTTLILPAIVPAISSSAGAIIRHGPHHSAQKSTTTGSCALSTSASKVASDTLPTPMGHLVFLTKKGASGARGIVSPNLETLPASFKGADFRRAAMKPANPGET